MTDNSKIEVVKHFDTIFACTYVVRSTRAKLDYYRFNTSLFNNDVNYMIYTVLIKDLYVESRKV